MGLGIIAKKTPRESEDGACVVREVMGVGERKYLVESPFFFFSVYILIPYLILSLHFSEL